MPSFACFLLSPLFPELALPLLSAAASQTGSKQTTSVQSSPHPCLLTIWAQLDLPLMIQDIHSHEIRHQQLQVHRALKLIQSPLVLLFLVPQHTVFLKYQNIIATQSRDLLTCLQRLLVFTMFRRLTSGLPKDPVYPADLKGLG